MPRKYIRFNYFSVNLVPDGLPENMAGRDLAAPWDMTQLLDYLSVRANIIGGDINVGIYLADFERNTLIYDHQNNLYSFQISKLRENNIPSLKRIGTPREDIALEENQYIGEFVTVVFDPVHSTVGVQSNIYSLNVPQIETYLTDLRRRFKAVIGENDPTPLKVEFNPIIDNNKIQAIQNADIYRKITIKGSNFSADALAQQGTLNEVSEVIGRVDGVNFELTLSLGHAPRDESLNNESIQEIIEGFTNIADVHNRPKIEISAREDFESPLEVVNLLSPRLTNIVSVVVENRTGIGHELVHDTFVASYQEQRRIIARVNRPIEN
jgi:hypothetical protein